MLTKRYGDLRTVAAHTDGDCHLCHESLDLDLYGPTGHFGPETVTVDHLVPQSVGGGDEPDNLRLAHGSCNSRRGTRDVAVARLELAGTSDAPLSSGEKAAWSIGAGSAVALGAGHLFARQLPDGTREFNGEAALVAGVLGTLFVRAIL
ncbi:MAG: HNH endonuclease [Myxococcales bacterium]|nr:HNH endonuclease [Myxococcales bacterium]